MSTRPLSVGRGPGYTGLTAAVGTRRSSRMRRSIRRPRCARTSFLPAEFDVGFQRLKTRTRTRIKNGL